MSRILALMVLVAVSLGAAPVRAQVWNNRYDPFGFAPVPVTFTVAVPGQHPDVLTGVVAGGYNMASYIQLHGHPGTLKVQVLFVSGTLGTNNNATGESNVDVVLSAETTTSDVLPWVVLDNQGDEENPRLEYDGLARMRARYPNAPGAWGRYEIIVSVDNASYRIAGPYITPGWYYMLGHGVLIE